MNVPIANIHFKSNVRSKIDKKERSFQELTNDIKQNGLIQPLVVYNKDDKYYLIAGHRRLEALKELGTKLVPIHELSEPNGDFTRLQLSENTMRKDLTLYEEIMAFKNMVDTNMTITEVASKFGHSSDYVKTRVGLGNLIPQLLKADTFENIDKRFLSELKGFAKHHKSIQKEALEWVAKRNKQSVKEYYENEFLTESYEVFQYPGLTDNKFPRETMVEFCNTGIKEDEYGTEPEERFKNLQKAYGYKVRKAPTLFAEEEYNDYCSDVEFVKFIWTEIYPEAAYEAFHKIKIDKELRTWDDNCQRGIVPLFLRYIFLRECAGQALQKPKIMAWNGDWDEPIIKGAGKKKTSTNDTPKEKVDKGQYHLQTKKFGRAIATDYLTYLKDQIFVSQKKGCAPLVNVGVNGSHIEDWMVKQGTTLGCISVQDHIVGYNLDRIRDDLPKAYNTGHLKDKIYECLILESMNLASFKELNKLAKKLGLMNLKEWFKVTWTSSNNEEFRFNVLSCFSTANLTKISSGKKKDIIEYAIQNNTPFPFLSIFSSKEAEWNDLSLKFVYLDKSILYND